MTERLNIAGNTYYESDEDPSDSLKEALQQIIDKEPQDSIRKFVAKTAIDYSDPASFFRDLASYGCISGMVSGLICYHETHAFFDKHYDEIEDIRTEISKLGITLDSNNDLKNQLVWAVVEIVAAKIADEIG